MLLFLLKTSSSLTKFYTSFRAHWQCHLLSKTFSCYPWSDKRSPSLNTDTIVPWQLICSCSREGELYAWLNSVHWHKLSSLRWGFISASPAAPSKVLSGHTISAQHTVIYSTAVFPPNCVTILEAPWRHRYFLSLHALVPITYLLN